MVIGYVIVCGVMLNVILEVKVGIFGVRFLD